jgi:hypothetical protein
MCKGVVVCSGLRQERRRRWRISTYLSCPVPLPESVGRVVLSRVESCLVCRCWLSLAALLSPLPNNKHLCSCTTGILYLYLYLYLSNTSNAGGLWGLWNYYWSWEWKVQSAECGVRSAEDEGGGYERIR